MIVSVPFFAPKSPPDTGASNASAPFSFAVFAIFSARLGVLVVKSTKICPEISAEKIPDCP